MRSKKVAVFVNPDLEEAIDRARASEVGELEPAVSRSEWIRQAALQRLEREGHLGTRSKRISGSGQSENCDSGQRDNNDRGGKRKRKVVSN